MDLQVTTSLVSIDLVGVNLTHYLRKAVQTSAPLSRETDIILFAFSVHLGLVWNEYVFGKTSLRHISTQACEKTLSDSKVVCSACAHNVMLSSVFACGSIE